MLSSSLIKTSLIATSISLVLSACGGGGGSSADTNSQNTVPPTTQTNSAPVIADMVEQTVNERNAFTFTASATDSDGTINNMSWIQKSGIEVPNTSIDGNTISFNAPAITEDQTVVFTLN